MAKSQTADIRGPVRRRQRPRSSDRKERERKAVEIATEIAIELHKPALKELEKH